MAVDESSLQKLLETVDDIQSRCTNCGICLEDCATFSESGLEHYSPRGRIDLARALIDGRVLPSDRSLRTFDTCTDCGACEAACPIGVRYSDLKGAVQEIRLALQGTL